MEVAKVSQDTISEPLSKDTVSSAQKEKNSKDFGKLVIKAATKTQNKENADTAKTETKEANRTENLENIKNLIDKILSSDDTKTDLSQNDSDLLSMLSMLIKNLQEGKQDLAIDKVNILSSLKSQLNLSDVNFTKLSGILDKLTNNQVINGQTISNKITNVLVIDNQGTTATDIKQEIFNLLSSMKNSADKDNNLNASSDIKSSPVSLEEILPEIKQILASNGKNAENTNADKGKKEEKFLNSLASGDKKDDINSKVTNMMNQFNLNKNSEVNVLKEPNAINHKTIASDIIKTLKYMETSNIKNLTVKIVPKELGEITVNLTVEAGVMKATITAANKDAYNLIQGSLQDINSKLVNNDVKISTLSLNLYNEDTTYYSGQSQGNNFNDENKKRHKNISKIPSEEEKASNYDNDLNSNVNKLA